MNKPTKFLTKKQSILLLAVTVTGGLGGAALVGHIADSLARHFLLLSDTPLSEIILPSVLLGVALIVGTVSIFLALKVENDKLKYTIIAFNFVIPPIIEIVDLSIRGFIVISELATVANSF